MRIEPKVKIKYELEDGEIITFNILDAKTRHLEQYCSTLTQKETVKVLRELRNSLRHANTEIDSLQKRVDELSKNTL